MNRTDCLHDQVKDLQTQQHVISEKIVLITHECEQWSSKRDHLNQQSKILRNDIHNLKTLRNEFNDQIKHLKALRENYEDKLYANQQDYHLQERNLANLQQQVTSKDIDVQQEIKRLEWSIQTSPYSALHERQIIKRITVLEHEAQLHHDISRQIENQTERMHTLSILKTQINIITFKIQKLAIDSHKNHKLMLTKVKQLVQNQEAADQAHQYFVKQRTRLHNHQSQYNTLDRYMQLIIQKINQNKTQDVKTSLHIQLASKGSEAKKKIKAQKRISFNEFKVLKEKGYI